MTRYLAGLSLAALAAAQSISGVSDNRADYANSQIPLYSKLEISFSVTTSATSTFFPYDASPPSGVDPSTYPRYAGVSVDGLFSNDNFVTTYEVPAFYYEGFDEAVKDSRDWYLRNSSLDSWKVRFAPTTTGAWKYKLRVTDGDGSSTTGETSFTVVSSSSKGFLGVSSTDSRYFEYSDGTPFVGLGWEFQVPALLFEDPEINSSPQTSAMQSGGANFTRLWISPLYGSAWLDWIGDDNHYDGYMPRAGLEPRENPVNEEYLTLVLGYNDAWYDACRGTFFAGSPAVEQSTTYKIEVDFYANGITGPRVGGQSYGLVLKVSDSYLSNCEDTGTGTVISSYSGNQANWTTLSGAWNSGSYNIAPRIYVALENVNAGAAWIRNISMKKDLGGGSYGPEMFRMASQEYETYVAHESAFAFDKIVELCESAGVYLKVVLSDVSDVLWSKLDDDGTWVIGGESDNTDGEYGLGRTLNKTHWLLQAWWRYAQARWGYSTAIHSWELFNEGDPGNANHLRLTDEMGKFFRCRAFGQTVAYTDATECAYAHPNRHMVTTSFWSGWPANFWGHADYPNVDYADVHAYIFTSPASAGEKATMKDDAAYQHWWHSDYYGSIAPGVPIVRGETGMDTAAAQDQQADLQLDLSGIWFHNWLWAQVSSGAMYDLYWWTADIYGSSFNHRANAGTVAAFLSGLPLDNGNYVDSGATGTAGLRIVGQKDLTNDKAHLWIQNTSHTWRNVVDEVAITPITGTVNVTMAAASTNYTVTYWNTYTGTARRTATIASNGSSVVTIPITALTTDIAVKVEVQ